MFGLFRKKNAYEQPARGLYGCALDATRQPCFYNSLGVPDTLDGRFDLLILHCFLIINDLRQRKEGRANALGQGVFDIVFADMDQGLRESGIGDMGVPKHMRRMMKGFNGRMHAYEEALAAKDDGALKEVLARNLYGTIESPDQKNIEEAKDYVLKNIKYIAAQEYDDLASGRIEFLKI